VWTYKRNVHQLKKQHCLVALLHVAPTNAVNISGYAKHIGGTSSRSIHKFCFTQDITKHCCIHTKQSPALGQSSGVSLQHSGGTMRQPQAIALAPTQPPTPHPLKHAGSRHHHQTPKALLPQLAHASEARQSYQFTDTFAMVRGGKGIEAAQSSGLHTLHIWLCDIHHMRKNVTVVHG
jgi:hypothetical protein